MARSDKGRRPRHVPQRTCIACRQVAGKRGLVRLVRTGDGVIVDTTGKMPGRGAYLHPSRQCWTSALDSARIQQALRTKLTEADRQRLAAHMSTLPEDDAAAHDVSSPIPESAPRKSVRSNS